MPTLDQINPTAVYSKAHVAALLDVSEKTIERWAKQPSQHLPAPFYQGRRVCWLGSELLKHFAARQTRAIERVAI